jgi:hypothetical protein
MSTLTKEGLQALLNQVGVEHSVGVHPELDSLSDLFDVYRSCLVDFIVRETGCNVDKALGCLQWPSEVGDLTAVLPRLRLQNFDAAASAAELASRVSHPKIVLKET